MCTAPQVRAIHPCRHKGNCRSRKSYGTEMVVRFLNPVILYPMCGLLCFGNEWFPNWGQRTLKCISWDHPQASLALRNPSIQKWLTVCWIAVTRISALSICSFGECAKDSSNALSLLKCPVSQILLKAKWYYILHGTSISERKRESEKLRQDSLNVYLGQISYYLCLVDSK